MSETLSVRVIAFGAAAVCLGLAFAFVTGMPGIVTMLFLWALVGAPVLVLTQGWLGIWLLALGGLWAGGLLLGLTGSADGTGFGVTVLVLLGLSALGVAIVPPQVAARHRAAWPFGYLDRRRTALKSKRDRLLMEEEIVYDVIEDYWEDEDDAEQALPLPKRKSGAR